MLSLLLHLNVRNALRSHSQMMAHWFIHGAFKVWLDFFVCFGTSPVYYLSFTSCTFATATWMPLRGLWKERGPSWTRETTVRVPGVHAGLVHSSRRHGNSPQRFILWQRNPNSSLDLATLSCKWTQSRSPNTKRRGFQLELLSMYKRAAQQMYLVFTFHRTDSSKTTLGMNIRGSPPEEAFTFIFCCHCESTLRINI